MLSNTYSGTWTPRNSFHRSPMVSSSPPAPSELLRVSNRTTELLKEVNRAPGNPWDLYRSFLPFTPSSSPLRKVCGHRFDPIRIFSISGEFSGHMIPLSEKALGARKLMEAKLDEWQKKSGQGKKGGIDYESAFCEPDVRNGVVTCAAISPNGHYIALAFGSGIIEISDIDKQHAITRFECDPPCSPAWVEFIHGNLRIATEDINGNITILDRGMEPIILGTLASGHYPAVTVVSDNGLLIARAPQDLDGSWYNAMTLLHVSGDPRIQLLAPPNVPILPPDFRLPVPHRHTIGFSPGARYIGAFDGASAFTWSTESCDSIAYYHVTNFSTWFLNPGIDPPCSYFIPDLASIQRPSETDYLQHPATDREYDSDESWIKCPFYDLQRSLQEPVEANYSSATGRALLHGRFSEGEHLMHSFVWFNGKRTLEIPTNYVPIACKLPANSNEPVAWYGDRVPGRWLGDQLPFRFESPYCPRSSRDGTRFVLQGRMKAPIVVDISQVI
ncbi:uncharacterized protein EI90DRAFT_101528 [Cantharellus anzutake]|uniref:uncharacterized protein n=1 Tax=Cantharellus anzutake TaxID=1750568 RepID=UPI001902E188|nr:uncharacterized protein EI90DRAFT_101528 [Cantharellus anzutake]KAF8337018.1 hypothetical protein EI90DRAFT_101528 [Cantharellus anzutake]